MSIAAGKKPFSLTTGLLFLGSVFVVHAEFTLNFQTEPTATSFPGQCNIAGFIDNPSFCSTAGAAGEIDPDTTPFIQESINIAGTNYWHQIVGDPADGFAMDIYIEKGAGFTSDSGGQGSNFPQWMYNQGLDVQSGNGWDPLELNPDTTNHNTGNGSADPNKVVMRQILGGAWDGATKTWSCNPAVEFCLDVSKESLANKFKITQTINEVADDLVIYFEIDMSNSSYADDGTVGNIINTLSFSEGPGSFDMATDGQNTHVTGGLYKYIDGAGWIDIGIASGFQVWDYDEGTYQYSEGGFDHLNQGWGNYYDPSQNSAPGPGNEGKCDSGAITGSCP